MEFLESLNEAQKKAVEHINGPAIIIAGAGSGKTRVLTFKIAYLIKNGIDPFNILSLTFTNKAAREMKQRISSSVGEQQAKSLWMGTFHSVFAKILRIEHQKIGFPSNFTIYDTDDSKSLIKTILKDMNLDAKVYKPGLVYNRISSAKNNLLSANDYAKNSSIVAEDTRSSKPLIYEIYKKYQSKLLRAGAMDFDDLLFRTNELLRDDPQSLHKYQNKFKYILVDEFQDTNFSQFTILKRLAALFENITVVGDDAQSIYAFRGANIQNILNFKKTYPDAEIFRLEQNYRSTKNIVNAANSVISKNKEQLKKTVWTQNDEGEKIRVFRTNSDQEEGMAIANEIFRLNNETHLDFESYAILYRTNAQSRALEEALRKSDIPYRIYGGLSFYQRKEIKDLLGYFRVTLNPNDEEAIKRVINFPVRGIGKTTIDKMVLAATENEVGLWEVLTDPVNYNVKLNGPTISKIKSFADLIKSFRIVIEKDTAYDSGQKIAASSGLLKEYYSDKSAEGLSRYENIQELLAGLKEFSEDQKEQGLADKLPDFMNEVALLSDQDSSDDDEKEKVTLMTIHAAKGLEFPYVFVTGLEENLFPSQLSINSRADLEEERRLFYVAITRAEKRAHISYALTRFKWGNLIYCEPSRFIEDIEEEFLDYPYLETQTKKFQDFTLKPKQTLTFPSKTNKPYSPPRNLKKLSNTSPQAFEGSPAEEIITGVEVEHQRFGKGKVLQVEGQIPNKKATVFFQGIGQKQLLLKFAKLKVL